jgi:methyl-accepting chemotaxis protein
LSIWPTGLSKLSHGNLDANIDLLFDELYERLRMDFNSAVNALKSMVQEIAENSTAIGGENEESSSAADDLSCRTEQSAAALEETAAALEVLTASVKSAAQGANHARVMVEDAKKRPSTARRLCARRFRQWLRSKPLPPRFQRPLQ